MYSIYKACKLTCLYAILCIPVCGQTKYEGIIDIRQVPKQQNDTNMAKDSSHIEKALAAVRDHPRSGKIHVQLAFAYYHAEQYKLAVEQFKIALRIEPHHSLTRYYLGTALRALQRPREAIHVYLSIIKDFKLSQKQLSTIYQELASAYWDLGEYDSTVKEFRKSLQYNPCNGNASFGLGEFEAYNHRLKQSRVLFLDAIKNAESKHASSKAYAALGMLDEETGDTISAIILYQKALVNDKHNQIAISAMNRLRNKK